MNIIIRRRFRLKRMLIASILLSALSVLLLNINWFKESKSTDEKLVFDWEEMKKLKTMEDANATKLRRNAELVATKHQQKPKPVRPVTQKNTIKAKLSTKNPVSIETMTNFTTNVNNSSKKELANGLATTSRYHNKSKTVVKKKLTVENTSTKKFKAKKDPVAAAEAEFVRALFNSNNEADRAENTKFDRKCDESGEWETISNLIFFKRTGGFYFYDANLIRVHLLIKSFTRVKFHLNVSVQVVSENRTVYLRVDEDVKVKNRGLVSGYNFAHIDAFFDVNYHIKNVEIDNMKLEVRFDEKISQTFTKSFIRLAVKLANEEKNGPKSGAMICSKCLNVKALTSFSNLKWWLELNKNMGFNRISICNHSIENSPKFSSLFTAHKDLLTFTRLECVPNLISGENKYFKSNLDIVQKRSKIYNEAMFDVINQLVLNECYHTNRDLFKYIAVLDIDELFLAKRTSEFFDLDAAKKHMLAIDENVSVMNTTACNRYETNTTQNITNRSYIESYLQELEMEGNITEPRALHFQQAIFLDNFLMKTFFDSLEKQLPKNASSKYFIYPLLIKVTDKLRYGGGNIFDSFNFEFVVSNKKELLYSKKLLRIYKTSVEPFIVQKNAEIVRDFQGGLDRFFMIQDMSSNPRGKTIHTYNPTVELSHTYLTANSLEFDKSFVEDKPANVKAIPFAQGRVSHFRRMNNFQFRHVPIRHLHLDLNYANCYLKPMIIDNN